MPSLAPGTPLGPYEVVDLLGRGGMGEVYRAVDRRIGRTVAIKVLGDEVASDPVRRQRFEREARIISHLKHPNICALLDVGRQDDIEFLVMEYLEGETLDERLERGPLPVREAVRRTADVADALTEAHGRGIVHRDVKPGNIMVTADGTKLLDFGLAKPWLPALMPTRPGDPTSADSSLTTEGVVIGTVAYMSPEQLEGHDVTASADIFALGAVMFEMVTGRRAFPGASPEQIIANVLAASRPSVSRAWKHVPQEIDAIVARCLARSPNDRWQSAADLRNTLRSLPATADQR